MAAVCAYVEISDGKLKKSAAEVLGEGRRLADALGDSLDALLIGKGATALGDEVAALGADRALVADSDAVALICFEGSPELPLAEHAWAAFNEVDACRHLWFLTAVPGADAPQRDYKITTHIRTN